MKITLDALDGRNFTLRIPLDEGRGVHVIALHDTKRLRGTYEHDAARFALDPLEADAIVGEVSWVLAAGSFVLAGPATLGATRVDVDIRRDDQAPGVTGEVSCAALDAPAMRFESAGLRLAGALGFTSLLARHDAAADVWTVALDALEARSASVAQASLEARFEGLDARSIEARIGGGTTALSTAELVVREVSFAAGDLVVKAAAATIAKLGVSRDATGATTVEADAIELTGVEVESGRRRVRSPSLRLGAFRYSTGGVSMEQLLADELSIALEGLGADEAERVASDDGPSAEAAVGARRTLGVDLPLLDGIEAKVEADIVVDVKLPVVKRRVATHRVRLEITDGALDFKVLEHGLSPLEDAIIDFEVVDEGLLLELDAVLMKRELLLWPLDAEGMRRARQNRVRLRTLARPTMVVRAASTRGDDDADPSVALERLEVRGLRVEGAIRGASSLPMAGGTLRLGRAGGHALGSLRLHGELVYAVAAPATDTVLTLDVTDLDVGVDAVVVGGRSLDVERIGLERLSEGRIMFHGLRPSAVTATLRGLSLKGLRLSAAG